MGSKDKVLSILSADKGVDDIGLAQPSGAIQGETGSISGYTGANYKTGRSDWQGKLAIYVGATGAALLKKGEAIRLANSDPEHTGLTRVLSIVGSYAIVNIDFAGATGTGGTAPTGMWFKDGGAGAWDAFMPVNDDLTGANIASITFWDTKKQGAGATAAVDYLEGHVYAFPGIIKSIQLSAGNIRLFRAATLRPEGKNAQ